MQQARGLACNGDGPPAAAATKASRLRRGLVFIVAMALKDDYERTKSKTNHTYPRKQVK